MKYSLLTRIIAVALISVLISGIVYAEEIMPRADEVFVSAFAYINGQKKLTISCVTYDVKASISITSCWYEKKINGEWETGESITVTPSSVSNSMLFGADVYCTSEFGKGTYRVGFTVDADGHSITRYSNEYTY